MIPYVVFGISLLLLFHTLGIPRSILTVVIGHIVICIPYTILVVMPRLQQIDVSLEEAAYDLGASRVRTFRSITLPLILPAVVSAFLIAFTTSFDEYAVASFVVGTRVTFPIYLYSALRFPSQLPQVIAVAVVVITVSLAVVVAAEIGRRVAERRLGAIESSGGRSPITDVCSGSQDSATGSPGPKGSTESSARWWQTTRPALRVDVELRVHAEIDDLGDRPLQPRPPVGAAALDRPDLDALGAHRHAERVARAGFGADRHDDALALAEPHDRARADELVDRQLERVERADEVGHERGARMLVDLARAPGLLHLAAVHDGDPVGHRERLFLVVRHVDERRPELVLDALELELHLLAQLDVERAERLVEEQRGRPVDESARQRDALLLAAGELPRPAALEAFERDDAQQLADARSRARRGGRASP